MFLLVGSMRLKRSELKIWREGLWVSLNTRGIILKNNDGFLFLLVDNSGLWPGAVHQLFGIIISRKLLVVGQCTYRMNDLYLLKNIYIHHFIYIYTPFYNFLLFTLHP